MSKPDHTRYFPNKPADVTCETCPYSCDSAGSLYCYRHALDAPAAESCRCPEGAVCGEHPWFVQARADLFADTLADAAHKLARDIIRDARGGCHA